VASRPRSSPRNVLIAFPFVDERLENAAGPTALKTFPLCLSLTAANARQAARTGRRGQIPPRTRQCVRNEPNSRLSVIGPAIRRMPRALKATRGLILLAPERGACQESSLWLLVFAECPLLHLFRSSFDSSITGLSFYFFVVSSFCVSRSAAAHGRSSACQDSSWGCPQIPAGQPRFRQWPPWPSQPPPALPDTLQTTDWNGSLSCWIWSFRSRQPILALFGLFLSSPPHSCLSPPSIRPDVPYWTLRAIGLTPTTSWLLAVVAFPYVAEVVGTG